MKKSITIKADEKTILAIKIITEHTGYTMTAGIETAIKKYAEAIIRSEIDIRKIKI